MKFVPEKELTNEQLARFESLPFAIFAYDDGYAGKKIVSDQCTAGKMLPAWMGTTTQRMSTSTSVLGTSELDGVEIQEGVLRYLFGNHAVQQLGTQVTSKLSDEVTESSNSLRQFLMASLQLAFPKPGTYRLRGMVMMPVSAFQADPNYKSKVAEALQGVYTFSAFTHFEDNTPVYETYTFYIEKVVVIEQPMGSLFRVAFDPASGVDFDEIKSETSTFLDWGRGTLDILTIDNMVRIEKMSRSAPVGMHLLFEYVQRSVLDPLGLQPPALALEEAIGRGYYKDNRAPRFRSESVNATGGKVDLTNAIQEGLALMWAQALLLFEETIGLQAPGIDNIFLTGGGAGWLEPFVKEYFGEDRVFTVLDNVTVNPRKPYEHLMRSKDLHLRNALGGYLLASRSRKKE